MRDYSNSEISNIIDEWIHNKRDREALKMAYIDGDTHEIIAEHFLISPRTVDNIIAKGTLVIEKHMT